MKRDVKRTIINYFIRMFMAVCLVFFSGLILFILVYYASNIYAKSKGENPLISIYTIISPSMVPEINVYDVIIDFKVNSDKSLNEGDIITFNSDAIDTDGYTITHRIVKKIINEDGSVYYVTRGDNNDSEDKGYITKNNVVGKVHLIIPQLGKVQVFLSSRFGWLLFILIPALVIIINDITKIVRLYKIRHQTEELPDIDEVEDYREKEENVKLKELIERANNFNKK